MSEITDTQVTDLIEESTSTTIEGNIPEIEATIEPEITQEEVKVEEAQTEDSPLKDLMFDNIPVTIDVPDDVRQLAESKGFDAEKLISELFKSETFKFTPETRSSLDEAYGKTYVDFMLKGLKAELDGSVKAYKDSIAAKEQAEAAAYENALAIVGGEEGWAALEAFANSQGDDFMDGLNSAMTSGNRWLQEMALNHAVKLMNPTSTTIEEPKLELLTGDGKVTQAQSYCTREEYREAISNGEYNKDPAKWDALRRAGMSKGL